MQAKYNFKYWDDNYNFTFWSVLREQNQFLEFVFYNAWSKKYLLSLLGGSILK